MTTINPQPGEAWLIEHDGNEVEALRGTLHAWFVVKDGQSQILNESVVDPIRRFSEPTAWEILLAADGLLEDDGYPVGGARFTLTSLADRLKAENEAEQEEAAKDAEREALIEKAAIILHHAGSFGQRREWDDLGDDQDFFIVKARVLADAGFLTDPKAQA